MDRKLPQILITLIIIFLMLTLMSAKKVFGISITSTVEDVYVETEKYFNEVKILVEEVEKSQALAKQIYESFGATNIDSKPQREEYGEEYIDAVTKWLIYSIIPEADQSDVIKQAFLQVEPFSNDVMEVSSFTTEQVKNVYSIINDSIKVYNEVKNLDGSIDNAIEQVKNNINKDLTNLAEEGLKNLLQEVDSITGFTEMIEDIFKVSENIQIPNKLTYGEEYFDALAKWMTVSIVPEIDQFGEIESALNNSLPFLEQNLSILDLDKSKYEDAYDFLKTGLKQYTESINFGKNLESSLNDTFDILNNEVKDYASNEIKSLISDIEVHPQLEEYFYNEVSKLTGLNIFPTREDYGANYDSAVTNFLTYAFMSETEKTEQFTDILNNPLPFLDENFENLDLNLDEFQNAYNITKSVFNTYTDTRENGGSINNALSAVQQTLTERMAGSTSSNLSGNSSQNNNSSGGSNSQNNSSGGSTGNSSNDSSGISDKVNTGNYKPEITNNTNANAMISKLFGALQIVGMIAVVLSIALVGFNTMLGSAEEKAQGKGKSIGILFGAIMITAVSTIAKLIISAVE